MTTGPVADAGVPADPDAARRRFLRDLGLLAAAGIAPGTAAAATPAACLLTPAATEGPFYLDDALVRADIRDGRPGQPLRVRIRVVDAGRGCAPVPGALVSIWHCDAQGHYSGEGHGGRQARFLRGVQPADSDGVASFTSIYPGWYAPRAIHIHFKVLLGRAEALTSQLYFSDALNREVLGGHPAYRAHGVPSRATVQDPIAGTRPNLMAVRQAADAAGMLEASFTVGIARA
ncbi:intradiol ring-cleavage dioxygenase [Cupriavidus alkaliphilus]|uniref:Protocatechuate 3,4-dioxygenase beta subunit n=1 Tax=Cupriavidus alkaliphilus TaxID=942866 RepID=A0A7W4VC56_9BURK|nr:intradiol ring-cleavage dioxygenase [Cupriavidus alkaliphilus]MBB3008914.1 protocatechuate 3,4-dioxygenase beta subunit [Cupriavidus alkaliphilus]